MVQVRFQPTLWIDERLEISGLSPLIAGQHSAKRTRGLAPSAQQCRKMLCEIREHLRLPSERIASLLGVPLGTLRTWLGGERNPSGAAKRLIWTLHCALFSPAALRKLDSWLGWAKIPEGAVRRVIDDWDERTGSSDVGNPPRNQIVRNGSGGIKVRKLRNVAKFGQTLGHDIRYIGIFLLVQASAKVSESIADCEARIAEDGLDLKTKIRLTDLKIALIDQQLSIAHEMLELKRELARNPPVGRKTRRRRRSFSPGEKVVPAVNQPRMNPK